MKNIILVLVLLFSTCLNAQEVKQKSQWVNLSDSVENYGYIKKLRVNTKLAAQKENNCGIYFVAYYEDKPTYLVLNTNTWVIYIAGDEYKRLNSLPKKNGWVEFDFKELTLLYKINTVENAVPLSAIQICVMNENDIAEMNKKIKPYEEAKAEMNKKNEPNEEAKAEYEKKLAVQIKAELHKKYGKKYVDAADRGEVIVGMHEDLVALVCMIYGSQLQMTSDNGKSQSYDIYAMRVHMTGYNRSTERRTWIGSVRMVNHKVASVTYGDRWSR